MAARVGADWDSATGRGKHKKKRTMSIWVGLGWALGRAHLCLVWWAAPDKNFDAHYGGPFFLVKKNCGGLFLRHKIFHIFLFIYLLII